MHANQLQRDVWHRGQYDGEGVLVEPGVPAQLDQPPVGVPGDLARLVGTGAQAVDAVPAQDIPDHQCGVPAAGAPDRRVRAADEATRAGQVDAVARLDQYHAAGDRGAEELVPGHDHAVGTVGEVEPRPRLRVEQRQRDAGERGVGVHEPAPHRERPDRCVDEHSHRRRRASL